MEGSGTRFHLYQYTLVQERQVWAAGRKLTEMSPDFRVIAEGLMHSD
jgi:hypothetical protein